MSDEAAGRLILVVGSICGSAALFSLAIMGYHAARWVRDKRKR